MSLNKLLKLTIILSLIGITLSQKIITKLNKFIHAPDFYQNYDNIEDTTYSDLETNPDEYLTPPQIIRRHGYVSESHVVETEDGFLLTLHRIPVSRTGKIGKQPVFLQHGLLSSSADWVISGNKSLVFMLSDQGYDVWLGNCRGNTYSRAHVSLNPKSAEFWNFTFHEMGIYDLPAVLSYVSNNSNEGSDIIYIGHSMGTTMFYVYASMFPDKASTIVKIMVGLAPVAFMKHTKSPVRYIAPWVKDVEWIFKNLGYKEFLPNKKISRLLSDDCDLFKIDKICDNMVFVLFGFDKDQFDVNMFPLVAGHSPAGISTKTILHYAQEIHHDAVCFMQYDYGEAGNIIQYGTPTPPSYNLSNINVPTYFMFAQSDKTADSTDVHALAQQIKTNIGLYDVPLKTFNHIDFLWAKDAPKLVYEKLLEVINVYSAY